MSTVTLVALLIAAATSLPGVALLARGLRGRRTDDHPICRRCGFDLFGRPDESTACPECGGDTTAPRAVRVGTRQRRPGLVATGVLLLLAAGIGPGVIGIAHVKQFDIQAWKPVWLLTWEAGHELAAVRTPALAELTRRVSAGELTDDQVRDVAERALAHQADLAMPWIVEWGLFIETAAANRRLAEDQWDRYVAQALQCEVEVRPVIRRGDPVPFRVRPIPRHVGLPMGRLWPRIEAVRVPEATIDLPPVIDRYVGFEHGPAPEEVMGAVRLDPIALAAAPSGAHELTITTRVTGDRLDNTTGPRPYRLVRDGIRGERQTFLRPFTLLPPGKDSVVWIDDESLRPAMEAAVSVASVTLHARPGMFRIEVPITLTAPPAPGAFAVVFRYDDIADYDVGTLTFKAGQTAHATLDLALDNGTPTPKSVDVILIPSLDVARMTVDMTEVWKGQIVVRDLPVSPEQ